MNTNCVLCFGRGYVTKSMPIPGTTINTPCSRCNKPQPPLTGHEHADGTPTAGRSPRLPDISVEVGPITGGSGGRSGQPFTSIEEAANYGRTEIGAAPQSATEREPLAVRVWREAVSTATNRLLDAIAVPPDWNGKEDPDRYARRVVGAIDAAARELRDCRAALEAARKPKPLGQVYVERFSTVLDLAEIAYLTAKNNGKKDREAIEAAVISAYNSRGLTP